MNMQDPHSQKAQEDKPTNSSNAEQKSSSQKIEKKEILNEENTEAVQNSAVPLEPIDSTQKTKEEPAESFHTQEPFEIPEEKVLSEVDPSKEDELTATVVPESSVDTRTELMKAQPTDQESFHTQESVTIPEEKVLSEIDRDKTEPSQASDATIATDSKKKVESTQKTENKSIEQLLNEMEALINRPNAGKLNREFNQLKELANHKLTEKSDEIKNKFIEEGNPENEFHYEHPLQARFTALQNIFKEKHNLFLKEQEEEYEKNLNHREQIIERLKALYTETEPGTNLFSEIRSIKKDWSEAGHVARSEYKLLYNNYFHHLNQFYEMLDLNKEYLEQEYSHNLEKRQHIIERAKELLTEPVQMALNELQYLHKLWKEEGEPVAEEFRETTWQEFKSLSNQIHDRRQELHQELEISHRENLARKKEIIAKIKEISTVSKETSHSYYQKAITQVEKLRSEFLKIGSVPKDQVNSLWDEFKSVLREFNKSKNQFYKNIKESQNQNLEKKMALIKTAQDNMHSEDWETLVPLYKNLQKEWKQIGHVPRSVSNKTWADFKEACNTFFNNYRDKSSASGDDWNKNFQIKKQLLSDLKEIDDSTGSVEQLEDIKSRWNATGKVPKDKLQINSEFNKVLKEKLKINKITEFDLKDENLSESQLTDKARKIKNQISDLESEIATLETNLGFFQSASRDNPLLTDTYEKIDSKRAQVEQLKTSLHHIISGE